MAVSTTVRPTIEGLTGQDVRFPIGVHHGYISSTGDATGGTHTITYQWTNAIPDLYLSVEYVAISLTRETALNVPLTINTQQVIGQSNTVLIIDDVLQCPATAAGSNKTSDELHFDDLIFLPNSGTSWTVVVVANNSNLESFTFVVAGFMWDKRAIQIPGGPLRPGTVAEQ